jgi:predicted DNA-binding transcriptional regulator AlpA
MVDQVVGTHGEETKTLWTDKQVAAFLHVSVPTIRRWRKSGQGPEFYRVGTRIKYDPHECAAWLASRKARGGH